MRILVCGANPGSLLNFRGKLISELVESGHHVLTAASNIDPVTYKGLVSIGAFPVNVEIHRTGINFIADLKSVLSIFLVLRKAAPDLVLFYTSKPVIYGGIAARLSGVRGIYSMVTGLGYAFSASSLKSRVAGVVQRLLYRLALRFSAAVIFQNPDDEALFRRIGLVTAHAVTRIVNGSGVDIQRFQRQPLPPGPPIFLTVARLLKAKGIREYCEAARIVRGRHPEVEFRIVGWVDEGNPDGFTQPEFDRLAKECGINFIGRLKDVRPQLEACSVFVLPSYREGTPRSVLEALATGRPVITTDTPGCRETVVDGVNGFLVPVMSVDGLVEAMEKLIARPELLQQFATASRHLAEEKYSVDKVNADIIDCMGLGKEQVTCSV